MSPKVRGLNPRPSNGFFTGEISIIVNLIALLVEEFIFSKNILTIGWESNTFYLRFDAQRDDMDCEAIE